MKLYPTESAALLLGAATLLLVSMSAFAGPGCDHPNFYVKGCEYDFNGQDGSNGRDGTDGIDGIDGRDGVDGIDGINGLDGRDGKDGVDGRDGDPGKDGKDGATGPRGPRGYNGTDGRDGKDGRDGIDGRDGVDGKSFSRSAIDRVVAASTALDIHQSTEGNRVTFGASRVNGAAGFGIGYSYRDDDRRVYKVGVSRSGSETLVKGSISLEF